MAKINLKIEFGVLENPYFDISIVGFLSVFRIMLLPPLPPPFWGCGQNWLQIWNQRSRKPIHRYPYCILIIFFNYTPSHNPANYHHRPILRVAIKWASQKGMKDTKCTKLWWKRIADNGILIFGIRSDRIWGQFWLQFQKWGDGRRGGDGIWKNDKNIMCISKYGFWNTRKSNLRSILITIPKIGVVKVMG